MADQVIVEGSDIQVVLGDTEIQVVSVGEQGPAGTPGATGATGPSAWGGIGGLLSSQTDLQAALDAKEATANKGAANGYAPLDAGAKVPLANLPAAVAGALSYQGTWNAATNTPALASGVGMKGYYYKVSVAGTTSLDGHAVWSVDDAAIFDGATWDILQGGVTSGEVTAALGFTPENAANKDTSGGYVGLTLMAINFWNSAKTFMSRFTNANTAARTYTFQDRDGTIADHTDTLAAFATGGAIAPASINGVTVDATTNKPVTAASLNGGTLPIKVTTGDFASDVTIGGVIGGAKFRVTNSALVSTTIGSNLLAAIGVQTSGADVTFNFTDGVSYNSFISAKANHIYIQPVTAGTIGADFSATGLAVTGSVSASTTISTGGYTVATLPAGSVGMQAYVTDALAPTFLATVVGGGAVVTPVFYNGSSWIGS